MAFTNLWKRFSATQLNVLIQTFALISIFFEGYDQGVMGGVNASPNYVVTVGIGRADGTVTDTTKQGGIVSCYYLGAIFGCFVGGWLADLIGRVNGLFYATFFCLIGGALQSATQNLNFIICARVFTGIGTGALTGITPVFISEVSKADHRGGFLGYVFIANYLGISIAYWLDFGLSFVDGGASAVRWRFLLAFQCFPALLLLAGIKLLPDSPRYLVSAGRISEGREVLEHLRGGSGAKVEEEFLEICALAAGAKKSSPIDFARILLGLKVEGTNRICRRAWLSIWLQIMASWTGITAVTAYSPVLLKAAGYSQLTQNGLAGGINTIGIVGTIISAIIVDKLGRRACLMGGAFLLFAVNIIAGAVYEASRATPSKASQYAPAAVAMLFLFNLFYAATWGTVAFLIPTEIFPSQLRAQGNGFGVTGWAIGVGMTVLVNPIMFNVLQNRTYFLFGGLNLLWIPIVYLFYPETANRSLESIEALFSVRSLLNKDMERAYRESRDVLSEHGGKLAVEQKAYDMGFGQDNHTAGSEKSGFEDA